MNDNRPLLLNGESINCLQNYGKSVVLITLDPSRSDELWHYVIKHVVYISRTLNLMVVIRRPLWAVACWWWGLLCKINVRLSWCRRELLVCLLFCNNSDILSFVRACLATMGTPHKRRFEFAAHTGKDNLTFCLLILYRLKKVTVLFYSTAPPPSPDFRKRIAFWKGPTRRPIGLLVKCNM